jgi:hypothetical protein
MASPVIERSSERFAPLAGPGSYKSRMLERYLGFLAKCEKPHILDLGPITGSGIAFYLEKSLKVSVCDIMRRLYPSEFKRMPHEEFIALFDYERSGFDGIHLWDIADHLETKHLTDLIRRFCTLLRPNGMIMMLASNEQVPQTRLNYFIPDAGTTVTLKHAALSPLPYFFRSNRDLEIVMKPLELHASFVCQNGIREFLFRR